MHRILKISITLVFIWFQSLTFNHYTTLSEEIINYKFENIIIDKIERGNGNSFYSIGEKDNKLYICYSNDGIVNLKIKFLDSILIQGNVIVNNPPIPYSIKFFKNHIYIGYNWSTLVKYDLELNPIDTIILNRPGSILNQMFICNDKLIIYTVGQGINDKNKKFIFIYDNENLEELEHPNKTNLNVFTFFNVYNQNELYFKTISGFFNNGIIDYKEAVYFTKDLGITWDSLELPKKYENFNIQFIELYKYDENNIFCNAQMEKYPDTIDYFKNIPVILFYNQKTKEIQSLIQLDQKEYNTLGYYLNLTQKYYITYSSTKIFFIDNYTNEFYFDFKNRLGDLPILNKLSSFAISDNNILISGNHGNIIEINLDILSTIRDNNANNIDFEITNPYPNPTRSEVTAKFYWDSRIDIDNSEIAVFDLNGNKVSGKENLRLEKLNEWSGNIKWNCTGVPSGTYLIKIQHGNNTKSVKVVVN